MDNYLIPILFKFCYLCIEVTSAWDNKGDIVVGNDVWIGYEAVILAGVHIGDGAVIGARAVVTHDVEPYTVVGGVPAGMLKKRFDPATIADMLEMQWWNWPPERVAEALPMIRSGAVDALKDYFRKMK